MAAPISTMKHTKCKCVVKRKQCLSKTTVKTLAQQQFSYETVKDKFRNDNCLQLSPIKNSKTNPSPSQRITHH